MSNANTRMLSLLDTIAASLGTTDRQGGSAAELEGQQLRLMRDSARRLLEHPNDEVYRFARLVADVCTDALGESTQSRFAVFIWNTNNPDGEAFVRDQEELRTLAKCPDVATATRIAHLLSRDAGEGMTHGD